MNITIYFEDTIVTAITRQAQVLGKSRNAIIREALKEWLTHHKRQEWPENIRAFKGFKDIKSFELYRKELKISKEDPFV